MARTKAEMVDNTPFRDYIVAQVAKGTLTYAGVAQRVGWVVSTTNRHGKTVVRGDYGRIKRMLGLTPDHGVYTKRIRYDNAVKLVRALDVWPIDFGV